MRWIITGLLLVTAAGNVTAGPSFRLGGRFTLDVTRTWDAFYDTSGTNVGYIVYDDDYRGAGCWFEYGPVSLFRFRLNIAEVQFFNEGGGALATFPATGLDVTVEPPFKWRVLPYLWFGGGVTAYWGWQGDEGRLDPRFVFGPDYHVRAGLGARMALTRRLDISADVQLAGVDTYTTFVPLFPGALGTHTAAVALYQARLGATWGMSGCR